MRTYRVIDSILVAAIIISIVIFFKSDTGIPGIVAGLMTASAMIIWDSKKTHNRRNGVLPPYRVNVADWDYRWIDPNDPTKGLVYEITVIKGEHALGTISGPPEPVKKLAFELVRKVAKDKIPSSYEMGKQYFISSKRDFSYVVQIEFLQRFHLSTGIFERDGKVLNFGVSFFNNGVPISPSKAPQDQKRIVIERATGAANDRGFRVLNASFYDTTATDTSKLLLTVREMKEET